MEPLILLLIAFLILIVVLPFVAIAKANAAKRTVDDLLARLSSVEDDLGTLRQSASLAKPGAPVSPSPAIPPPLPVTAPAAVREAPKESEPPPIPQALIDAKERQAAIPIRPPIDWEQFMGAKLFAWIGGLALFLGVAFFVKYSFEHNLIPPELRVAIGFLVGASLLIGGLLLKRKENAVTAQTLCATGILVLYAVTFACRSYYHFRFFGLIPTFLLMSLITAVAFLLAVRLNAIVIAVLPILGAVGTSLMQFVWIATFFVSEKYFAGNKVLVVMAVFAGFQALFLAAAAWSKRTAKINRELLTCAIWLAAVAMCSAFYLLSFQTIAQRPTLLFSYLFVVDLGLLALTLIQSRLVIVEALAGLAAFIFLGTWTGNYLTTANLYVALAFYFVFALFHATAPLALQRLRRIEIPWWSHAFPALALLLVLMPIFQLSQLSIFVWPFVLIVDLLAIVLALTTATLLPILGVLLLTLVTMGAWLCRIPSELTGLPIALCLLGGFAIFFLLAASWASRRLVASGAVTRAPNLFGNIVDPVNLSVQLPALSATLPFLLLIMVTLRLPLANPSPVFGLALLLIILLLGMSELFSFGVLPAVALVSVLALEHAWHFQHFDPARASLPLLWYLGFYALFTAFPFIFHRRS